jgi:hypothetical protein
MWFLSSPTEHCWEVVNHVTSGWPGFKSRHWHHLYLLMSFIIFLCHCSEMLWWYLTNGNDQFPLSPHCSCNRSSSVKRLSYGLDILEIRILFPEWARDCSLLENVRPALRPTQPPIKWVLGVKRQGREPDHSPPTSAEVKKKWICTSTPSYVFMA